MKLHSIIGYVCFIASIALLALAYGPTGDWPALIAIPAALVLWILLKKWSVWWGASILLCVYLVLAGRGIMLQRPLVPLILGSMATLIWWDLADFGRGPDSVLLTQAGNSLQKYRLQSLALTTGSSLLLAAIGIWLRFQLPLGVIALLILLIMGCFVYAAGVLRRPPLRGE